MKLSHTILTLVAFAFLFAGCDSTGAGGGGDGGTVTYEIGDRDTVKFGGWASHRSPILSSRFF